MNTPRESKRFFRQSRALLFAAAVALLAALSVSPARSGEKADSSITTDADLIIAKKDLSRKAQYYPVQIEGQYMEIIAVIASDNSIRVVFNACVVCYKSGKGFFLPSGDDLVCQNCGNRYPSNSLEMQRGGCNPVPVGAKNRSEKDGNIIISQKFLKQAKDYFAKL